jgi:hypothetical protein
MIGTVGMRVAVFLHSQLPKYDKLGRRQAKIFHFLAHEAADVFSC